MIVTVNRQQAAGKPATMWLRGTKPLARPQRLALISASFGKAATGGWADANADLQKENIVFNLHGPLQGSAPPCKPGLGLGNSLSPTRLVSLHLVDANI